MKKLLGLGTVVLFAVLNIFSSVFFVNNTNFVSASELSQQTASTLGAEVEPYAYPNTTFNYVSLGDSIASGYALNGWSKDIEYGVNGNTETDIVAESYTYKIQQQLESSFGAGNVSTVNYARSGDKIADLMDKLDHDRVKASIRNADLITISIGANDILSPAGSLIEEYIKANSSISDTYMLEELNKGLAGAQKNFPNLLTKLNTLVGPNTQVVFLTTYNPYRGFGIGDEKIVLATIDPNYFLPDKIGFVPVPDIDSFDIGIYESQLLNNYINRTRVNRIGSVTEAYLQGTSTNANGLTVTPPNGINKILRDNISNFKSTNPNFGYADIYEKFNSLPNYPPLKDSDEFRSGAGTYRKDKGVVNAWLNTETGVIDSCRQYSHLNWSVCYDNAWNAAGNKLVDLGWDWVTNFDGCVGEVSGTYINTWLSSAGSLITQEIPMMFDPHPTRKGHTVIKDEILSDIKLVTFNANGGTLNGKPGTSVFNGSKVAQPGDPTRSGYAFGGWYKESDCINIWSFASETVTSNTTLYAKWQPYIYKVTLDNQSATTPGTAAYWYKYNTVTDGVYYYTNAECTIPLENYTITKPTKAGYTFKGYFTGTNGTGTQYVSDTGECINNIYSSVAGDSTLYAYWAANSYIVTFDANGGAVDPTSKTVTFASAYGDLPTPTQNGFTFKGWYTAAEEGTLVTAETLVSTPYHHTLYAHWSVKVVKITFDHQSADIDLGTSAVWFKYREDVYYTDVNCTTLLTNQTIITPQKTGYYFSGYFSETNGNGTNYVMSNGLLINNAYAVYTEDVTLYANWTAESYTVWFDSNGGTVDTYAKSVTYNSPYGDLPTPTKNDYTFTGWFTEVNSGTQVTAETIVKTADTHTLYAHWTADEYTITYSLNDGTVDPANPTTYTIETETFTLNNPTKTGYTFTGWTGSNGETPQTTITIEQGSSGDKEYTANWTANTYIVEFDPNGGSVSTMSLTVTYDSPYGALPTPTINGYDFAGWFTEVNGGTRVTSATIVTTASRHTLFAHWAASIITVTFNVNNGNALSPTDLTKEVKYDEAYGTLPTTTRNGHTFAGWFTEVINGSLITETTIVTATGDHVLYAHWTAIEYTITYTLNGGTATPENPTTYTIETESFTLNNPTKKGYTFTGWTGSNGETLQTTVTIAKGSTGNKSYSANWTANTYTVYFDANGGSVNKTSITVTYDSAYGSLPAPSRSGYTSSGWYTQSAGGTPVTAKTIVSIAEDHTLYARWNTRRYTISYNLNGGSVETANPTTYNIETETFTLNNPTKKGYTFTGWTGSNGETPQTTVTITKGSMGNKEFTANWTINSYIVTLNPNGGSVSPTSITVTYDSTYGTLPTPTRDGYTFAGWYTDAIDGTQVVSTTPLTETSDHTLYAHWTANTYVVTFNPNGGSVSPDNKTITYGSAYQDLPEPTRNGYTFIGWFTELISGTQVTSSTIVTETSNHTLYAHWTANNYYVTFNVNGGNDLTPEDSNKQVTFNEVYGTLPTPTRTGYTFDGWFTEANDGTQVTSSTIVTTYSNHILYAHWSSNYIKVTFDNQNADILSGTSVIWFKFNENAYYTDESCSTLLEGQTIVMPQKTGYTFLGYYQAMNGEGTLFVSSADGSFVNNLFVSSSEDLTLYANWTANTYTVEFNATGGSVNPTSKTVSYNSTYGDLPTPTKNGYTFAGWFTEANGGTQVTAETIVKTADTHTLYAHWTADEYTIAYSLNDGTVDLANPTTYTIETATFTLNNPTKTGYTFAGWTGSNGETPQTTVTITKGSIGNKEFTANWTANTYVVEFNPNGGSVNPTSKTVSYNSTYGDLPTATRNGYNFAGWFTEADGGTQVTAETTLTTASDHILYAHWSIISYTITYNLNDGVLGIPNPTSYTVETGTFTLNNPSKTGYTFAGWTGSNGETPQTIVTIAKGSTGEKAYTANWVAIVYTITYTLNGGTATPENPTTYTIETETFTLNNPTKTGYSFTGWFDLENNVLTPTVIIPKGSTGNKTFAALWLPISCTVTFDANGGQVDMPNKTLLYDSNYGPLPTPTRDGYAFMGWYTDATSGTQVTATTKVTSTVDHTLYAHWSSNSYIVTFINLDGSVIDTMYVAYGEQYGNLPTPSIPGYSFDSWRTSDGTIITKTSIVGIANNHYLYINCHANTYKVILNNQDADISEGTREFWFVFGENIFYEDEDCQNAIVNNKIITPEKTGYVFGGYYESPTGEGTCCINSAGADVSGYISKTFTQNTSLYAKWTHQQYTVTFAPNGGVVVGSSTKRVSYNSEYGTLPSARRSNYIFAGWSLEEDGAIIQPSTIVSKTRDHVLYANWEQLTYHNTESQYLISINNAVSVSFSINVTGTISWFDNGVAINGQTSNTLSYKPTTFGQHLIYCKVDGVESNNFKLFYYQAPTSATILKTDSRELNKYELNLNHNSEFIDHTKLTWYKQGLAGGTNVLGTGLSTEIIVDQTYTIFVVYDDGTNTLTADIDEIKPKFNVVFDTYGGIPIPSAQIVLSGSQATEPEKPTKTNYIFGGWTSQHDTIWNFSNPVEEDLTLSATWKQIYCTDVSTLTQYVNQVKAVEFGIDILSNDFVWKVESNDVVSTFNGTNIFSFTPTAGNKAVYTVWCELYGTTSNKLVINVEYFVLERPQIKCEEITRNTYKFSIDATEEHINNLDLNTFIWHYTNVETNYPQSVSASESLELLLTIDHVFDVYATYSSSNIKQSETIRITPRYMVQFETYSSDIINDQMLQKGSKVIMPTKPSKTSYIFAGWFENLQSPNAWDFNNNIITQDITLNAKWVQMTCANEELLNQYVNYTSNVEFAIDTTYSVNWYVDDVVKNTHENNFTFVPEAGIAKQYIIYCIVDEVKSNEIAVNVNYYIPDSLTIASANIVKNQYRFNLNHDYVDAINPEHFDWYQNINGQETKLNIYGDKTATVITFNDISTVYVVYDDGNLIIKSNEIEIIPAYIVSLIVDDFYILTQKVNKYEYAQAPDQPTRNEFIFAGWFKESTFNTEWDFNNNPITEDTYIYAKWVQLVCLNENLLLQYTNNLNNIYFSIDLPDGTIEWYINGEIQPSNNSNMFTFQPEENKSGEFIVNCKAQNSTSNVFKIKIYYAPISLEIKYIKQDVSEYLLFVNTQDQLLDETKLVWYIKMGSENYEVLGTGLEQVIKTSKTCEVYAVYQDDNLTVTSNLIKISANTTNYIVWIIAGVGALMLAAAASVIVIKIKKSNKTKKQQNNLYKDYLQNKK